MPKVKYSRYKMAFVVYLINVYQPCTIQDVFKVIPSGSIDAFKGINTDELREIVDRAKAQKLLIETADGWLHLTYWGMRLISEMRLAFPRDKNRLFYLKNVVAGRRNRG